MSNGQDPEKKSNGTPTPFGNLRELLKMQAEQQLAFQKLKTEEIKAAQVATKTEAEELKTNVQRVQAEAVADQLGGGKITEGDAPPPSRLRYPGITLDRVRNEAGRLSQKYPSSGTTVDAYTDAQDLLMRSLQESLTKRNVRYSSVPFGNLLGGVLNLASVPFTATGLLKEGVGTMVFGETPPPEVRARMAMEVMATTSPAVRAAMQQQGAMQRHAVDTKIALARAGISKERLEVAREKLNLEKSKAGKVGDLTPAQAAKIAASRASFDSAIANAEVTKLPEKMGVSQDNAFLPGPPGTRPMSELMFLSDSELDPTRGNQLRSAEGRLQRKQLEDTYIKSWVQQHGANSLQKLLDDANAMKNGAMRVVGHSEWLYPGGNPVGTPQLELAMASVGQSMDKFLAYITPKIEAEMERQIPEGTVLSTTPPRVKEAAKKEVAEMREGTPFISTVGEILTGTRRQPPFFFGVSEFGLEPESVLDTANAQATRRDVQVLMLLRQVKEDPKKRSVISQRIGEIKKQAGRQGIFLSEKIVRNPDRLNKLIALYEVTLEEKGIDVTKLEKLYSKEQLDKVDNIKKKPQPTIMERLFRIPK